MPFPDPFQIRGVKFLDADPIVTFDSRNPKTLAISFSTEKDGVFHFRMDADKAERMRYRLGRALTPESEPIVLG